MILPNKGKEPCTKTRNGVSWLALREVEIIVSERGQRASLLRLKGSRPMKTKLVHYTAFFRAKYASVNLSSWGSTPEPVLLTNLHSPMKL